MASSKIYKSVKVQKKYSGTVPKEVFDLWQNLRRKKDSEKLTEILELSRPSVDKALNLGFASLEVTEKITQFFTDRSLNEKAKAAQMVNNLKGGSNG